MTASYTSGLVWLRRDLRLHDNSALYLALRHCQRVHVAFVFDTEILDPLPRQDRRVDFIHAAVTELDQNLRTVSKRDDTGLLALHGPASRVGRGQRPLVHP